MRRLESNERERMRMHSLNDAFEVTIVYIYYSLWGEYELINKSLLSIV